MARSPLPHLLLAAPMVWLCAAAPQDQARSGADPQPVTQPAILLGLDIQGGSGDDAVFAREATGLRVSGPVAPADFRTALDAVRLTDRFRKVDGELVFGPGGARANLRLDPWPPLKRVEWRGDTRRTEIWKFVRGLRPGMSPGDLRLAEWSQELETRVREAGFPEARVMWVREQGDRLLAVTVDAGSPARVEQVDLAGDPAPYTREEILAAAKLVPGRTLWTPAVQLATARNLHRMLQSHQRFEARVELQWDGRGTVRLTVAPGPRVILDSQGDSVSGLKELVPLARADRYSPELLDEGDRSLVRSLRTKGFLDAQVWHRREVTRYQGTPYEEVTVTYFISKGAKATLDGIQFEGNAAVDEAELRKAAGSPRGVFNKLTPDLMDAIETKVKELYLSRGFTETSLRRQLERQGGRNILVMRIREGPRRMLQWLRLELPPGGAGDPWGLGGCLPLIFSDQAVQQGSSDQGRTFISDRPAMAGNRGLLASTGAEANAPMVLTFTLARPVPLIKADLTRVFTALKQQRLPALGMVRPVVRLTLETAGEVTGVRIEVPPQPLERIQRLVVIGCDKTRADAVFRETRLLPGAPLDTDQLTRAQARLSYLGAFQRVDLKSMGMEAEAAAPAAAAVQGEPTENAPSAIPAEPQTAAGPGGDRPAAGDAGPPSPWKAGDLQLNVEERPPYVITTSFGYDKSQGYHVGLGLQQLNVGGMGRTIDYGIRAGNGTIHNPTLARLFPTGAYNRSVDSFTVGYTDPWFAPGALKNLLADHTQFRSEGAYIQELQDLYALHRRRFTNSLQWNVASHVSFQLGYRWERVDVASALAGIGTDQLAIIARYPTQTVVSAPFAQVARDTRDNVLDPTSGMYSVARVEFANQLFRTSSNSSFVKVDLRNQWTWPLGRKAQAGVVALGLRVGVAKPTAHSAEDLPLSERFFAGGPFTFRGVEPDALGAQALIPLYSPTGQPVLDAFGNQVYYATPVGGQGLALINLEYRFPILRRTVWGEVFMDSGQVYQSLTRLSEAERSQQVANEAPEAAFPPFRTALGVGLIFKIGIPLKVEYAADINRILGRSRSQADRDTQLKSLLVSAGFQF